MTKTEKFVKVAVRRVGETKQFLNVVYSSSTMADFQVVDYPAFTAFVTRTTCPQDSLSQEIPRLFGFIWNSAPDAPMVDAPCVFYQACGPSTTFECVVPVAAGSQSTTNGIAVREFPACQAFMGTHYGDFSRLQVSWAELWKQIESLGLQPDGAFWERYMTDPEQEADTSKWVTELYVPVKIQKF